MIHIIILMVLIGSMFLYIRLAHKFHIFDQPNNRSSHNTPTIRGGGVVFVFSIFIAGLFYSSYWLPVSGAWLIGVISFLDDRVELSRKLRFAVHLLAVSLMFYYLQVFNLLPVFGIIALYILVVGIINAYNFMDGINGITGLYSLTVLSGLQYVNQYQFQFIEPDLIWFPMLACLVFLYFNFRKKAAVFAGDVGSITIAFWIIFLILQLILKTNDLTYILFLAVYGVDSILTIIHRLILKQNIFDAHRMHFYQILANEQKIPHRMVSILYALMQILIIFFLLTTELNIIAVFLIAVLPLVFIYIMMKPKLMAGVKQN